MRDQRFSKHTLIEICFLQEKHPLNQNFLQFLLTILPPFTFKGTPLVEQKSLKNDPEQNPKRNFLLKISTFWNLIAFRLQKQPFFCLSLGACVKNQYLSAPSSSGLQIFRNGRTPNLTNLTGVIKNNSISIQKECTQFSIL